MRFLTCEPNLSHQANYTDEADIFYENPMKWLRAEYSSRKLPTHVILFDRLLDQVGQCLADHGYRECRKLFHTHIPEGRVGSHVLVWCLRRAQKQRVFRKSVWNGVLGSFISFYMESFSLVLPCMVMRTIHHYTSQSDGPFLQTEINSSPPNAVYIHQWIRSALVQITGATPAKNTANAAGALRNALTACNTLEGTKRFSGAVWISARNGQRTS